MIFDAEQAVTFGDKNFEIVKEILDLRESSCDTEKRHGFGNTAKNPDFK
jgi:hypothetical protein